MSVNSIQDNKLFINNIISRITQLLSQGEKVEMKNKLDFELTLEETKAILTKNSEFFGKIPADNSSFNEIKKKLYSKIDDLEDKLSKLSLIIFCRAKAEKYLENSRKDLGYINMVLLSILNSSQSNIIIPIPKQEIVQDDHQKYDDVISKLTEEIAVLKALLKEKEEKEKVILQKQHTSSIKLTKVDNSIASLSQSEALYLKGVNYFYGIDGSVNYCKALEYLLQSAKLKNKTALYLLGVMYIEGLAVEKDYSKGILKLREASQAGHSNSSIKLAVLAEEGYLSEEDKVLLTDDELANYNKYKHKYYEVALKYYILSSFEQNSSEGYFKLGQIYQYGYLNQVKDQEKAFEMYKKSAEIDNNSNAINAIGNFYYKGVTVDKDYKKAFDKFLTSSQSGNIDAINSLGICYELGHGVAKNLNKAIEFYTHGASKSHPLSMTNKAVYLIKSNISNDIEVYKNAFKLLSSSIAHYSKGNKEAFYYLGFLYQYGMYSSKQQKPDEINAFRMYKKAMKRGHINAITKVALVFYNGIEGFITKNEEEAIRLFREASDKNDQEAINYLGLVYEYGNEVVEKDLHISREYYLKAQNQGNRQATFNITTLNLYDKDSKAFNDVNKTRSLKSNEHIVNPYSMDIQDKFFDENKSISMNLSRRVLGKLK